MLKFSKYLLINVENLVNGYSFKSDCKSILIISLFKLLMQHHKSITLLVESNQINSSAALLRPLIDSCYRGLWVYYIATDEELENILNNEKQFKTASPIAKELDDFLKVESFSKDIKILNDFTHGGIQQIFRMIDEETIKSNFPEKDLKLLLETSNKNLCLFLHVVGLHLNDNQLTTEGRDLMAQVNINIEIEGTA